MLDERAKQVFLTAPQIVVADIETTGFSGKYDDIIEIGAVLLDVENQALVIREDGKPVRFDVFVKPVFSKHIPPEITQLTGITEQMVRERGLARNQAIEQFYQFISDNPVAFHNASFDWGRFLGPAMASVGRAPSNPIVCTLKLAKHLYPERKAYNLEDMCQFLGGVTVEGHHRAWVDCTYTASLLLKMRAELIRRGETVDESQLEMDAPEAETPEKLSVRHIQRWKKGQYDRIYVETNVGTVFYDLKQDRWAYKNLRKGMELNVDVCAQAILNQLGVTQEELAGRYV